MTELSQIKFYMVRNVFLDKWIGKHCSGRAFMTDDMIGELTRRGEWQRYATWWMDDPKHAKVWTDPVDIRIMRKRASRRPGSYSDPSLDSLRFTTYQVVRFPDMTIIPLEEI